LFNCGHLFHRIEDEIDFTRFNLRNYKTTLTNTISQINQQQGTGNEIKDWISINILPLIQTLDEFQKLYNNLSFG
jgi:hypothetical protein